MLAVEQAGEVPVPPDGQGAEGIAFKVGGPEQVGRVGRGKEFGRSAGPTVVRHLEEIAFDNVSGD